MADERHCENRYFAKSPRHMVRLMRNLTGRGRIARTRMSRDQNGKFRKFKMADGRHFENGYMINNSNNNNIINIDGLTLVPWQSGRSLVWDVTVVCPFADSYVASAAREARSVAELAATKKEDKYSGLAAHYLFQPIAVEPLGPINESAYDFLSFLAKKISHHSGDERETVFCSSAFPC